MRQFKLFDTNCFIQMTILYKNSIHEQIKSYGEPFLSNINNLSFEDFLTAMLEYENKSNHSENVRCGVLLTFLLDHKRSNDDLEFLSHKIIKSFDNLPFYAFQQKNGKGYYLTLYVCERHYYPEEKEIPVYATNDRYINAKSKKITTKNDPDAILTVKKGDLIKYKKVIFSSKEDFFKFATKKQFEYFFEVLKQKFMYQLKKLSNATVEKGISVKKFNIKKQSKRGKNNARAWNARIHEIEKNLNNALYALEICECNERKNIAKIEELRDQYEEMLINRSFVYKSNNHKIKIGILLNRMKYKYACADADLFLEKFLISLNNLMTKLIPTSI